jgi:hypothetical protein
MSGSGKAEMVRVMGIKWIWNYKRRRWVGKSAAGEWSLWYDGARWSLESPSGAIYALSKQHKYSAMVQSGYKIAEIERWLLR